MKEHCDINPKSVFLDEAGETRGGYVSLFKKRSEQFKLDKNLINSVLFTYMSRRYAGHQSEGFCGVPSG